MIQLKHNGTGSWLDPRSSPILASRLSKRLWERCRGHRGLCLTLTYDRGPYADSQDLYRRQSEEQHVPLFIRKVGRYLGEKLTGRWFCKMEFQDGGYAHFHIILLDVPRIKHAELARMWGHGFLWVKRLSPKAIHYCTKYMSKADGIPAWLYGERSRSIKIIRVSPGFWGSKQGGQGDDEDFDEHPFVPEPEPDPYPESTGIRSDCYVPIGAKIENRWDAFVARDERGHYANGVADLGAMLAMLLVMGCGVVGRDGCWLVIDADLTDLNEAARRASEATAGPNPRSEAERGGAAGDEAAIHLIQVSNPDADDPPPPGWLHRWMFEDAEIAAA